MTEFCKKHRMVVTQFSRSEKIEGNDTMISKFTDSNKPLYAHTPVFMGSDLYYVTDMDGNVILFEKHGTIESEYIMWEPHLMTKYDNGSWMHRAHILFNEIRERNDHLTHCYSGDNLYGCKYGDENCPAKNKHMMSLNDILNYSFKQIGCKNITDIEIILEDMNIDDYYIDVDKFDNTSFSIEEIYNNTLGGVISYRRLLYFKGEFCCIFGCSQDVCTVIYANKKMADKLRNYLMGIYTRIEYIGDNEVFISDDYTTIIKYKNNYYYNIICPYKNMHNEKLFYLDIVNDFLMECTFKEFIDGKILVKLMNGAIIETDYEKIIIRI